jgi:tetratricopeptide (TPR) repeat protein
MQKPAATLALILLLAAQPVMGREPAGPAPAADYYQAGVHLDRPGPMCSPCGDTEMPGLGEPSAPPAQRATSRKPATRKPVASRRPAKVAARPKRRSPVLVAKLDPSAAPKVRRTVRKAKVAVNDGVNCERLRDQAQALMDRGETQAADKMLKAALAAEPGRPCLRQMVVKLAMCRAHSAISCNYLECAARRLREVLYLEPNNRVARSMLNNVLESAGVNPDNGHQREHLAQCLASNGRNVGALVEFREAAKLNGSASTHIGLAKAALTTDQKSLALSEFRNAVAIDPLDPRSWQQIGFLEESRGQLGRAADAFLEAAKLNPNDPISMEKALQIGQRLSSQMPRSIDAKLDMAHAFLLNNQSDKAAAIYQQISQLQPDTPLYEDWLTLENQNIALKRAGYEHRLESQQLASNEVVRFIHEGPIPQGATGAGIEQSTGKLAGGCNCD